MNKLGFGFLRLPRKGRTESGDIDWKELESMVDEFLSGGGRYFDTAYTYLDGLSEEAFKRTVAERYPRDAYEIADKLPSWLVRSPEECEKYFEEQCTRCGVQWFDVYLIHWLNRETYRIARKNEEFHFLKKIKADGRTGKIGFSYHGDATLLEEILKTHPEVEVVQLQINYLDWESPAMEARKCYEVAAEYGKEIVVMEPVKGGILAKLPERAEAVLKGYAPGESAASWAIRFAQSQKHVNIVLSGMSDMEQMSDNMRATEPLTDEERALLTKVCRILNEEKTIPCTACGYCAGHCPMSIPVPEYFRIYNEYLRYPDEDWKIKPVYESVAEKRSRASDCIACHICERNCPQGIKIAEWMKKIAGGLEEMV